MFVYICMHWTYSPDSLSHYFVKKLNKEISVILKYMDFKEQDIVNHDGHVVYFPGENE